jgi:D-alanyl-D-alanine carboxypeptidase
VSPVPRLAAAALAAAALFSAACSRADAAPAAAAKTVADPRLERAFAAIEAAGADPELAALFPAAERAAVRARIDAAAGRFLELIAAVDAARSADPMLLRRVDKNPGGALGEAYEPSDLVGLDGTGLSVSRAGHRLRKPAFAALRELDGAAREALVVLLVSSSYRSYAYQKEVFARNAAQDGVEKARLSSAEPGRSQHQLGTAADFGSIDDSFADTEAGRWLSANASRFGFSLSYPEGKEALTGYLGESWHYRYVGKAAAALETEFFGGMQARMLAFVEKY